MNELLEFTGALIYLALNIILFPLFLLLQFMLWSPGAIKYLYNASRKIRFRTRDWKVGYQLRHLMDFVWER
jgi:hypothetical protein